MINMMSYVFVTIIIAGVILNEIKVVSAKGILSNLFSLTMFPKFMDLELNPAVKVLCDMTTVSKQQQLECFIKLIKMY